MRTRFFLFLALLAYVNTIFYEGGHQRNRSAGQFIDGSPLIEIILSDVLKIPYNQEKAVGDVQYDDYRPASSKWLSITPSVKRIEFTPLWIADTFRYSTTITLNTKISCLLGYYRFLSRLKPF